MPPIIITQIDFDQILRVVFLVLFLCLLVLYALSIYRAEYSYRDKIKEKNKEVKRLELLSQLRWEVIAELKEEVREWKLKYKALGESNDAHL